MKRRLIFLLVVSIVLLAAAGWYVYRTMNAMPGTPGKPASAAQPQHVQTVNGETVVLVAPDAQRASRIEVAPIAVSVVRVGRSAYATVVDMQPLFDLHHRLAAARADRESTRAQADASRAQYERSRMLFDDDRNVSQKSLQDALAAMQADQAKLRLATTAQHDLEASLRQQFGDGLADAAVANASGLFRRLSSGRVAVLRITLPVNYRAPARITADGPDGQPVVARKLSASPQSDPEIQGNPYLYAAERALPVGARMTARLPAGDNSPAGLLIPANAVVWYGGQPWAYVRTAPDRFTRRILPSASEVDHGFIVPGGFHAGDEVVVRGAQLLLSEELQPRDIATQCKDPPECDD